MPPVAPVVLTCPSCQQPLAGETPVDWAALTQCPQCRRAVEVTLLPGFGRELHPGRPGADRILESEPACYFHPAKKAEVPCELCGRFLCALCHLEVLGKSICPACLGEASRKPGASLIERERWRWDTVVWLLTIGPLLSLFFWFLTPFTCLLALGLGAWKFKSPPSRIHRSQLRLIAGMVTAALFVVGIAALLVLAIRSKG